jgi:ribosome maturation factor RimP
MQVSELVQGEVADMGYELVMCELINHGKLVRVTIDHPRGINSDDCARVSNRLTHLFAVEGFERYERLEVGSPGLDRVLVKPEHFQRFAGSTARIRLRTPRDGRKNFVGVLGALNDGAVELRVDGQNLLLRLDEIDLARLVPQF